MLPEPERGLVGVLPVRPWIVLVVLALLGLPPAAAHTGHDPGGDPDAPPPTTPPEDTPPWFGAFEDHPWFGSVAAVVAWPTPIYDVTAAGDYVVWAADGDVVALNVPSGVVFNVTADAALQDNPATDGRHVVYEERQGAHLDLFVYDIENGTTRRLTSSLGNEKEAAVRGDWVAWLDDRHGSWDVYALNLSNGTEFPVAISEPRKADVVLLGDGIVAWREVEYNQWDVVARRLPNGTLAYLTRDRTLERPPQTDGDHLYWVKTVPGRGQNGLYRWDPATGEIRLLGTSGVTTNPVAFLGGGVEVHYTASSPGLVNFHAINRTNERMETLATGFPGTAPAVTGGTLFIPSRNDTHHLILAASVSPYAVETAPQITIRRPLDGGVLFGPTFANGTYADAPAWPEPLRLEYLIGQAGRDPVWVPFNLDANWSVNLDLAAVREAEAIRLYVRAVYEGAPTVQTDVGLTLRQFVYNGVDLEGDVHVTAAEFVARNPGIVLLVALAAAFVVLLAARWRLRRRTGPVRIEFVRP